MSTNRTTALCRKHLREPTSCVGARCLYYRREDPTARAGSGRDHYQIILSSVGMLDDAAECGPDGHGADGVHKLVEDDVTVDAIMCCRRCTKDTHPHVTELHGGHDVLDSRLACISVTTQESTPAMVNMHESIDRCLPCKKLDCSHGWKTTDFDDGSGYFAERVCDPVDKFRWKSPGMIDHHEATANAYIALLIPFFLCLFHQVSLLTTATQLLDC